MDKVYIISRYRADTYKQREFNKAVARYFCRKVIDEGNIPVAPHIYYTQFLDDSYPYERDLGLRLALNELRGCQRFLMVIVDGEISEGMQGELAEVGRLGIPGRIINMEYQEIKEAMKVVR